MADGKGLRAHLRDKVETDERVRQAIDKLTSAETTKRVDCPKCGHRFNTEVIDARTQLEAIRFATEQGLGKTTEAESVDLSKDPLEMSPKERIALREKVEALLASQAA